MVIKKFTPILLVEEIENCLPFWEKQMQYEQTASVPHHGKIGFVILKKGESEVMLQSRASLSEDLPEVFKKLGDKNIVLYADVDSLEDIEESKTVQILVPRRETPYGAHEVWIREPSGNIIGFAQFTHA